MYSGRFSPYCVDELMNNHTSCTQLENTSSCTSTHHGWSDSFSGPYSTPNDVSISNCIPTSYTNHQTSLPANNQQNLSDINHNPDYSALLSLSGAYIAQPYCTPTTTHGDQHLSHHDKDARGRKRPLTGKPAYSYVSLIYMAIQNSPGQQATLKEIIQYIKHK